MKKRKTLFDICFDSLCKSSKIEKLPECGLEPGMLASKVNIFTTILGAKDMASLSVLLQIPTLFSKGKIDVFGSRQIRIKCT